MTSRTGRSIKRPRWMDDEDGTAPESPREHAKSKAKVDTGDAHAKASSISAKITAGKPQAQAEAAASPYSRRERVPKRTMDDEVGGFGVLIPKTRKSGLTSPLASPSASSPSVSSPTAGRGRGQKKQEAQFQFQTQTQLQPPPISRQIVLPTAQVQDAEAPAAIQVAAETAATAPVAANTPANTSTDAGDEFLNSQPSQPQAAEAGSAASSGAAASVSESSTEEAASKTQQAASGLTSRHNAAEETAAASSQQDKPAPSVSSIAPASQQQDTPASSQASHPAVPIVSAMPPEQFTAVSMDSGAAVTTPDPSSSQHSASKPAALQVPPVAASASPDATQPPSASPPSSAASAPRSTSGPPSVPLSAAQPAGTAPSSGGGGVLMPGMAAAQQMAAMQLAMHSGAHKWAHMAGAPIPVLSPNVERRGAGRQTPGFKEGALVMWTSIDDALLRLSVENGLDFATIAAEMPFTSAFSAKDLEERWLALLYDPCVALHVTFELSTLLAPPSSSPNPDPPSPPILLPPPASKRKNAPPDAASVCVASDLLELGLSLQEAAKYTSIRCLWTKPPTDGSVPPSFPASLAAPPRALAAIDGATTHYLLYKSEVVVGRKGTGSGPAVDVDLGQVVVRRDASSGTWALHNVGRRAVYVNGRCVAREARAEIAAGRSLIVVGGVRLVFDAA